MTVQLVCKNAMLQQNLDAWSRTLHISGHGQVIAGREMHKKVLKSFALDDWL